MMRHEMAAQHLPRDLVRSSSGLKELAYTMKNYVTPVAMLELKK